MGMFTSREVANHFRPAPKRRAARGTGERSKRKAAKLAEMRERKPLANVGGTQAVTLYVPATCPNPLNASSPGKWWVVAKHRANARKVVQMQMFGFPVPALPVVVTLNRHGPREMDFDGMVASLKGIVDGVADGYGIDDADTRIRFEYGRQARSKKVVVRIHIQPEWRRRAVNQGSDER